MNAARYRHMWRAHFDTDGPSYTLFVRGETQEAAYRNALVVASLLQGRPLEVGCTAVYNVTSFAELMESGVSTLPELRVFETGWRGNEVIAWVENPIFVLRDPRMWAEFFAAIPQADPIADGIARAKMPEITKGEAVNSEGETIEAFGVLVDGVFITDPYASSCGRFSVDPAITYGIPPVLAQRLVQLNDL